MVLEEQRFIHEELERLEAATADLLSIEPRNDQTQLARDHELKKFIDRIGDQSKRLLEIYKDEDKQREKELLAISSGDQFQEFQKQFDSIKDHHRRYPNEPVENLERAYHRRDGDLPTAEIANMFSGAEVYGKFLDLTELHSQYLNLPGVLRLSYMQYLEVFDSLAPPVFNLKRKDKLSDKYFNYVGELANYLEGFIKRARPLQNLELLFKNFEDDFNQKWEAKAVPGWTEEKAQNGESAKSTESIWCVDCKKEFTNKNVHENHLSSKKHTRAVAAREASGSSGEECSAPAQIVKPSTGNLKERAIAQREHIVRYLGQELDQERQATRINVERRQGMTERERQIDNEAMLAEPEVEDRGAESENEDDERVYNPLKLPMDWNGKPIPFWLYKLHGLGVEYPCEICGNFVYMGRRNFDRHFSEALHIHGLKCLGIHSNANMFREITSIDDAIKLWEKLEKDRKKEKSARDNIVEMEDEEGNVMPEAVYLDLVKQGIL